DKMAKILFPRCAAMIKREKQCFQVTLQALKSKITTIKEQFVLKNGGGSARCISAPDVCVWVFVRLLVEWSGDW
ncbi:MAG: hypothetical protein ACFNJR_07775, partial [Segatella oulorum]|uniref:hypothetical protein n=1 Tax=Segatella oulorum TaxID=28136 RepID=UPI00361FD4FB